MTTYAPLFDADGLHILDPADRLGRKSRYITLLQEMALDRHLPRPTGTGKLAVDVGCGYGRLTGVLQRHGWRALGIDPARDLIEYATACYAGVAFVEGSLPALPLAEQEVHLMLLHNVLRSLLLLGKLSAVDDVQRFLAPGGQLVVIENIRDGHPAYVPEGELVQVFTRQGLVLQQRVSLRAGRWWLIYAIRYGLVPAGWLAALAAWELDKRARSAKRPRRTYHNVLFVFHKPQGQR